jgi:hypothetical protein
MGVTGGSFFYIAIIYIKKSSGGENAQEKRR